jgi:tetratricopeptide (TPR) repeat protein
MKQAIERDPSFALAHVYLYRASALSYDERVAHLKQAVAHLNRLSERDALIVEAILAEDENRLDDALAKYQRLMARYPNDRDGYIGAAFHYRETGDPARAIEFMERAVTTRPNDGPTYNILGYMYLSDGRSAEAIRAFETYVKLRPNEPNSLDSLAEGHLAAGHLDRAMEIAQQASKAGHAGSRTTIAWIQAVQGKYDEALPEMKNPTAASVFAHARVGQYREAERRLTSGLFVPGFPESMIAGVTAGLRATFALERGDCRGALALIAAAAGKGPPPPAGSQPLVTVDVLRGTCEARTGQLDAARARLAQHRPSLTSGPYEISWLVRLLEGEIALAAGDVRGATAAFEAAGPPRRLPFNRSGGAAVLTLLSNSLILRDGLARARAAEGRLDDAIAIYRTLLRADPDVKFTAFYEPRYILAIARLLDKAGRRDEARREYARFLEVWKHADPDLPELAEARAKAR